MRLLAPRLRLLASLALASGCGSPRVTTELSDIKVVLSRKDCDENHLKNLVGVWVLLGNNSGTLHPDCIDVASVSSMADLQYKLLGIDAPWILEAESHQAWSIWVVGKTVPCCTEEKVAYEKEMLCGLQQNFSLPATTLSVPINCQPIVGSEVELRPVKDCLESAPPRPKRCR
jgi:hypothetical protein